MIYDVAVAGAGPAGAMAAIRAGSLNKRVVLVERNDRIGKKVLLTGKGRCNLTNTAGTAAFLEKFGRKGEFLRSAFLAFTNEDLIEFFKSKGLELKAERQGRVFPVTDSARSVVEVLERCLAESNVEAVYNARLANIKKIDGIFQLELESGGKGIEAKRAILATGGSSYKATGSAGDGFRLAESLGHNVSPLLPALVPLKTKETWVKGIQGLSLENVRVTFKYGKKKIASDIGDLIFTHFGVSGPLILDLSGNVAAALEDHKEVPLFIDMKPGLTDEQLEKRLLGEFKDKKKGSLKNTMKNLLPQKLVDVFMDLTGLDPQKSVNQITKIERRAVMILLKALPLTVTGTLPIEEAMVTAGGVSKKEIDPRTMESRLVPGLYFAGEIIEGAASSGGYNLQQAFSTGWLAGEKAACAK